MHEKIVGELLENCWRIVEHILHEKMQPYLNSNGTKLKLSSSEGREFEDATKYQQLVGSLIYLTSTRPYISYVVGILSKYMHKPYEGHCSAEKRVLRYLKRTQDFGLKYTKVEDFKLIEYIDLDFDDYKEIRVFTSRYKMSLGSIAIS